MAVQFDQSDIDLGLALAEKIRVSEETICASRLELGELAHSIETKYGEGTLKDFSKLIGVDYNTLKGCRTVHRGWKNSPVKPRKYSVAKALASFKDKDEFIKTWPNATEEEARD